MRCWAAPRGEQRRQFPAPAVGCGRWRPGRRRPGRRDVRMGGKVGFMMRLLYTHEHGIRLWPHQGGRTADAPQAMHQHAGAAAARRAHELHRSGQPFLSQLDATRVQDVHPQVLEQLREVVGRLRGGVADVRDAMLLQQGPAAGHLVAAQEERRVAVVQRQLAELPPRRKPASAKVLGAGGGRHGRPVCVGRGQPEPGVIGDGEAIEKVGHCAAAVSLQDSTHTTQPGGRLAVPLFSSTCTATGIAAICSSGTRATTRISYT
mmetsp:Transcript_28624/g.71764  ORF Transcript_28624/g.71764 Transcript_28624/m.71764 type:complete len:262 (-) Transcript_28624:10-795(-)